MSDSIRFRAEQALREGDLGDDLGGGFRIKPLGQIEPTPDPNPEQAEPLERGPLTRAQRERVPAQMVMELVQYFMDTLNDMGQLNPIRDGIPQCRNHPFDPPRQVGCIHSCAKRNPDLVLPVVKHHTLGDVIAWVKELVNHAVKDTEIKQGWRKPADLTR